MSKNNANEIRMDIIFDYGERWQHKIIASDKVNPRIC